MRIERIETVDHLISWLEYYQTKIGAPADNVIAAIKAEKDPDVYRICTGCKKVLPINSENFDYNGQGYLGYASTCIRCRRKYHSAYGRRTRRMRSLRRQNPNYDADQQAIEAFKKQNPIKRPGRPSKAPLDLDTAQTIMEAGSLEL